MYVWICTKGNLNCNLTCYNVQYVCIVFNWGNLFCSQFLGFHTCIFELYLYCAILDLCFLLISALLLQVKLKQLALLSVIGLD